MAARQRKFVRNWLIVILASMTFARLVWIQLREFNIIFDDQTLMVAHYFMEESSRTCALDLALPGARNGLPALDRESNLLTPGMISVFSLICRSLPMVSSGTLLRINLILFCLAVFSLAITSRLIASSWVAGFAVAAILFSRGQLINQMAVFSNDNFLVTCVAVTTLFWTHFVLTLYVPSLILVFACILLAALFNISALMLLAIPGLLAVASFWFHLLFSSKIAKEISSPLRKVDFNDFKIYLLNFPANPALIGIGVTLFFAVVIYKTTSIIFGIDLPIAFPEFDSSLEVITQLSPLAFDFHYRISFLILTAIVTAGIALRRADIFAIAGFIIPHIFLATYYAIGFYGLTNLETAISSSFTTFWIEPIILSLPCAFALRVVSSLFRLW